MNVTVANDVPYPLQQSRENSYRNPRLFYVPSVASTGSGGGGNQTTAQSTLALSLQSTLNLTDIYFAQEDNNRTFHTTGTMSIVSLSSPRLRLIDGKRRIQRIEKGESEVDD